MWTEFLWMYMATAVCVLPCYHPIPYHSIHHLPNQSGLLWLYNHASNHNKSVTVIPSWDRTGVTCVVPHPHCWDGHCISLAQSKSLMLDARHVSGQQSPLSYHGSLVHSMITPSVTTPCNNLYQSLTFWGKEVPFILFSCCHCHHLDISCI